MIPKLKFYHSKENEMYEVNGLRITQKTIECFPKDNRFSFITFEEDEGVLMQSTGLKDVHDSEFFDKGIARDIDSEELGLVEYVNGSFVMKFASGDGVDLYDVKDNFEIIGNQFENRELLEEW